MMLPKYIWFLFFISIIYMLYTTNYYTYLEKYVKSYYHNYMSNIYNENSEELVKNDLGEILFTTSALKKYTNLDNGLYLSILGKVFDVTNGVKHYGPGETYHVFTGRDASAAFITGDFSENGLTDDISGLTNKEIQSLVVWQEFYEKTYTYKGKLIGRYYNKDGSPTDEQYKLKKKVQIAKRNDSNEEKEKNKFPPCNTEWDVNTGTKVWCTKNSGGIARDWIGVPRMLYNAPESKQYRCACIRLESKDYEDSKYIIKPYEGCAENSPTCTITTVKE